MSLSCKQSFQHPKIYIAIALLLNCVTFVFSEISCNVEDNFWFALGEEHLPDVTVCDIKHCPSDCFCTLGNGTFITSCNNDLETSSEIPYPKNITAMYLGNISLNAIEPFAFKGIAGTLVKLYLDNNNIDDLHPGVFDGLSILEDLYLTFNKLSGIRLGVFDTLGSLTFLSLEENRISDLTPGVFRGLTKLRELRLDVNRLTELKAGIFDGLISIEELYVDDNFIEKVSLNVFVGLSKLEELDLDTNVIESLEPGVFDGLSSIIELDIDDNILTELPVGLLRGLNTIEAFTLAGNFIKEVKPIIIKSLHLLTELDFSNNRLAGLDPLIFRETPNLITLYLEINELGDLDPIIFTNLTNLEALSLAVTEMTTLPKRFFKDLHALSFFNISGNHLTKISSRIFKQLPNLSILDVSQNPLTWISKKSFDGVKKGTTVYVKEFATCCFVQYGTCSFEDQPSPFISCKRMLPYTILRIVVWLVSIAAIFGNLFVLLTRFSGYKKGKVKFNVQFLLITNLSFSDMLMGFYLLILLSADLRYNQYFPAHSESWRKSDLCGFAGFLSVLSSEASVFFITLISIDRFMSIRFPFSTARLRENSTKIVLTTLWLLAFTISFSGTLISRFSPSLYDVSEICVGFPISRIDTFTSSESSFNLNISFREPDRDVGRVVELKFEESKSAMFFSIAIFTVLNFLCFLTVAICYALIFITARKAARSTGTNTNRDREIRRAFKMGLIVFTDFCCWLVVIVLSVLVQSKAITIDPEAYAWIATFFMPINSCINPFLYTLSSYISKRFQSKIGPTSSTGTNPQSTGLSAVSGSNT